MERARRVRTDVRVLATLDGRARIAVGRGLAGRWEAGFEVDPEVRGRGLGRALVSVARYLIPVGDTIFMQAAAGNVASIRTILAGGFVPVCAEVLFSAGENPV